MDSNFHNTVMQRPQEDEDSLPRQDQVGHVASHNSPYVARSPPRAQSQSSYATPLAPYSPPNGLPRRPSFSNQYQPSTPAQLPLPSNLHSATTQPSSQGPPPTGPTYLSTDYTPAPRDKPQSNYYDPTSDSSAVKPSGSNNEGGQSIRASYNNSYPVSGESNGYVNGSYSPANRNIGGQQSPTTSHSHPPSRLGSTAQSAGMPSATDSSTARQSNGSMDIDNMVSPPKPTPTRKADPMSFSSILTESEPVAAKAPSASPRLHLPRKSSRSSSSAQPVPAAQASEDVQMKDEPHPEPRFSSAHGTPSASRIPDKKRQANGTIKKNQSEAEREKQIQAALAEIDEDMSDMDSAEFEEDHWKYKNRVLKRSLELEAEETRRKKLRRTKFIDHMSGKLMRHADAGQNRYKDINAEAAINSVQEREILVEKERKKDMQRKRRREKTVATNLEQKEQLLRKAQQTADAEERKRLLKEAERAEKKVQATKDILAKGDKGPEIRTVSPIEPNFAGGTMTTFAAEPEGFTSAKGKGKGRGGARLRKSKEQKQQEKDNAEAAQAAIDAGEELPPPPPEKEHKIRLKINAKQQKESEPREESPQLPSEPFQSKTYNQIYDQIWKDIAKKEAFKVRVKVMDSQQIKASNLKKTAILASKEAKRWQQRTNKGTKDLQARAKRIMREMMSFWKKNEREERDMRKMAEKQEIENAKKAEADREANRQKRKLNFLISQTELYSHFIGKKIKTDEVERSTDHPDVAPAADDGSKHKVVVPEGAAAGKVTNFEDLDFDAEDESVLQAAAMANAQDAIQKAQDKARAFNNETAMDEEGEMNFQNPSGMGEVDIEQPKMLQATLKEYQLKGLNWLANLYDQGINGILADEMGLGKTIQSISVMAYLAEKHGIWGPFLVVAPASTLHNWQQEITRFVPRLKCLPYWGTAGDRKVLRKFWDRKHITYTEDAPFHVLITSYQLVVSDVAYFQKMKWQYMILDEAQAIKSSASSRWKSLLGFHCRNRLLLTGTPIQNNMQELWALLHFIMPSLFDSHDEFSEWFSKDIESHATSNTKLNEDQLKRLHMILKPFMLRRVKKHVQKELGDKIEIDLFCDLTYRQRAYYSNLRNQISIMDLIEKATVGDDGDAGTLMNLVMQFRKVCNHPDLFERAETTSPFSFAFFAETGSFMREGPLINVAYSTRNHIEYSLPRLLWRSGGRLDIPGDDNEQAGFRSKWLHQELNIWKPVQTIKSDAFSWSRLAGYSSAELAGVKKDIFARSVDLAHQDSKLGRLNVLYDDEENRFEPKRSMLRIVDRADRKPLAEATTGYLGRLYNVARDVFAASGMPRMEQCGRPAASAPPIQVSCSSRGAVVEKENILFNIPMRRALYGPSRYDEQAFLEAKASVELYPAPKLLPAPSNEKQKFTNIMVPSMRRFVTDSGKLAKLDELLFKLKEGGHRVLLYFQMTRMIDLMEEYLTYRNYKYLRLDGSTKLEDRRDTVHDFQTRPEIFIFLLSTRAGGLGINLTSADTVIFYDSDWNPTIDSQAMDRAHRLGQTRQVTVYRMITRGTIEERIRKRAMQKEEVQRVVISGGGGAGVDFNTRSRESKTKDIAMWLADDEQAAEIERKEKEVAALEAAEQASGKPKKKQGKKEGKKKDAAVDLSDLYHEGEGNFDDGSAKPSGTATPVDGEGSGKGKKKGPGKGKAGGKKAKSAKQRLAMADGGVDADGDIDMDGM